MIQRKQSVFLFLAFLLLLVDYFFPLSSFYGEKDSVTLYLYKITSMVPDSTMPYDFNFVLPLLILNSLSALMSFVIIFLYKNRKTQMKLVKLTLFLVVIYVGLFFLYYVDTLEKYTGSIAEYNYISVISPLLAIVFLVFAYRGILSDEKLIKSADRLR